MRKETPSGANDTRYVVEYPGSVGDDHGNHAADAVTISGWDTQAEAEAEAQRVAANWEGGVRVERQVVYMVAGRFPEWETDWDFDPVEFDL